MPGLNFGYNYDGLGNRLNASKGQPALVTTYTPDAMNRYSTIESPGADDILVRSATAVEVEVDEIPVTVTTSGDFRGARITADNSTSPAFPETTIAGQDNFSETGHRWIPQAEFSPQYDDDGNLTNDGRWIYTWDAMNRLVGMTPTAAARSAGVPNQTLSFAYDHLSRRIGKMVTTTTGQGSSIKDCRYLYEGWNVVAQFSADSNNSLTPDATYLWSLDLSGSFHGAGGVGGLHSVNLFPLPLGEGQGEGAKLCLACYDANGNIIAWTDNTGRVLQRQDYDPFGNRVIRERLAITPEESDRLEYGFSTKPLDSETGLVYYIHRYYDPRHGHWLSQDPIEEAGGLNLYGFVYNHPTLLFDAIGLEVVIHSTDATAGVSIVSTGLEGRTNGNAWVAGPGSGVPRNEVQLYYDVDVANAKDIPDCVIKRAEKFGNKAAGSLPKPTRGFFFGEAKFAYLNNWIREQEHGIWRIRDGAGYHYAFKTDAWKTSKPVLIKIGGPSRAFVLTGLKNAHGELRITGKTGTAIRIGGRVLFAVAAASDVYEIYTAENRQKTVTKVVGGWAGAKLGAKGGAMLGIAIAGAGGQMGPQVAVPEEIVTVPGAGIIGGVLGGIGGYFAGREITEAVYEWVFEEGF